MNSICISLVSVFWLFSLSSVVRAQLSPDATLGSESSVIVPGVEIRGTEADLIEGGAIQGDNLFHSFTEFNVLEGQRVYFANPVGIESILSRVTGGNASAIFGTLGVDGGADLFLINPNGVVFGVNAALDVAGSLYVTTAEAVELGDGVFSAVAPGQSQLLSVNPNTSFWNYLTENSGDVVNRGQLAIGGDLVLAGNNLDLQGQVAAAGDVSLLATDTVQIRDTAEVPFVGFAGGDLLVQGNQQVDIVALSHPDSGLFSYGDMVLRSANPVGGDAHYLSGGDFRVEQLDGSGGELFSPIDPIVRTLGDVNIGVYAGSSLHILAGGSVTIGAAAIARPEETELGIDYLRDTITLTDGTIVSVDGNARPTLDVRAGMRPEAIGTPPFEEVTGFDMTADGFSVDSDTSDVPTTADITVGLALITAPDGMIVLTNNYEPNTALDGGDIVIENEVIPASVITELNLSPTFPGALSTVNNNTDETSGSIFLDARSNILLRNSTINASSQGDTGDIVLNAVDTVTIDGEGSNTLVGISNDLLSSGEGGNIRIRANNLELLNGANIRSSVSGQGQGGDIFLDVQETILIDGSYAFFFEPTNQVEVFFTGIASDLNREGQGRSGDVIINANSLEILDGAFISQRLAGEGQSGNIVLSIDETISLSGNGDFDPLVDLNQIPPSSSIGTFVLGDGTGGDVLVRAGDLRLLDGAEISNDLNGTGTGGDIVLDVRDTIDLSGYVAYRFDDFDLNDGFIVDQSGISAVIGVRAQGQGGDIEIRSNSLNVLDGAEISTNNLGFGEGGDIVINVQDRVLVQGRQSATSAGGISSSGGLNTIDTAEGSSQNGSIFIQAGSLEVLDGPQISSDLLGRGTAGNIVLNIRDTARFTGNQQLGGISGVLSRVLADGQGQGGDIEITAGNLEVLGGSELNASIFGIGNAGNITLEIQETAYFAGNNPVNGSVSGAFSTIEPAGQGRGGNLQVTARNLTVSDGAQFNASTWGVGNAGNVTLFIEETASFVGSRSNVSSQIEPTGEGQGGDVRITARNLEVRDGAQLSASTSGRGDAGNVILLIGETASFRDRALDNISNPSGAFSSVARSGEGQGGDVQITSRNLEVRDGAQLSVSTLSMGNAGNVRLFIDETADFVGDKSGLFSQVEVNGIGQGGNVLITANNLNVLDGAQISSSSENLGDAGDIIMMINETASFIGIAPDGSPSGAFSQINFDAIGQGGDIRIIAHTLDLLNGATLSAASAGQGDPGEVSLLIDDRITLQDSTIETISFLNSGGQITLNADTIVLLGDSDIITFITAENINRGGDITINANALVAFDDSDILAFARNGRGGNIDLSQTAFFSQNFRFAPPGTDISTLDGNGRVDINASGGIAAGQISIGDVSFIENNLNELPNNLVNPETLVANSCIARRNDSTGTFVLTGSDSLPQQPTDTPHSTYTLGTVQTIPDSTHENTIIEPQGVYRLADGRLVMSRECG